nr:putative reverse transcriptase domain-containing protein [Tanacetum cinerariifolium]
VGERVIEGPEMIEVTNEKVAIAKEKLKEARTRQKSYADKHHRSIGFQPEPEAILDRQDRVMMNKTIPFIKILWRNHPEREATWETEEVSFDKKKKTLVVGVCAAASRKQEGRNFDLSF